MADMKVFNLNNYRAQQGNADYLEAERFKVDVHLTFTQDEMHDIYALYAEYCQLSGIEYNVKGNTLYSFIDAMIKLYLFEHIEANAQFLIDIEKGNINF